MMKIGVIGLGGISQKAYLPVMMAMGQEVEWHLYTRNQEKLKKIAEQYRVKNIYPSIEALIDSGIKAAFVHTATETHGEIIRQLLENNIHVYVDKPISEDLVEVKALIQLAEDNQLQLVTGFNRRFAPMVEKLKAVPDKNMIFVQKNKENGGGSVQRGIYDMFIHVLDTAVYLLDDPILKTSYHVVEEKGELKNCVMQLITAKTVCVASMNYVSGANSEVMEVMSPTGTHRVVNLTDYSSNELGKEQVQQFGDWEPTLEKRGFAPLIRTFIASIPNGENPVSTESTLLSHELCHQIVTGEIKRTL
ncbi:Gfo/Idh/MocA family protein [Carnobacterium gallinarum]|uniref:Gfo/Idh/MocA family protein n=1 Tax=Carnobacterium gallinarum TaxID=2749 RepID=UPI0005550A4B|nr:Gfo/Idh/MocA family oxidoreductase [Carnobacterium gallinarum]